MGMKGIHFKKCSSTNICSLQMQTQDNALSKLSQIIHTDDRQTTCEYGVLVQWYWQEKTNVLTEEHVPVLRAY
jgi:hypothetical protein